MSDRQKCDERREAIAALVMGELAASAARELRQHISACDVCRGLYETLAEEEDQIMSTFEAIAQDMEAIKQSLLERLQERSVEPVPGLIRHPRRFAELVSLRKKIWKPALVVGAAALILLVVSLLLPFGPAPVEMPAFGLISQAWAAEARLFAGEGIVNAVMEIVVKPVSDPDLARVRWLPIVSMEATGRPRFHQLKLPAEPGEHYTVDDRTWYDPATGRFARVLTTGGKPIFANSYDGEAVYLLEIDATGASRIVKTQIAQDFRAPKSPAEFLGMSAGLSDFLKRKDEGTVLMPAEVTLADGSQARVVKAGPPPGGPDESQDTYWLFKIRKKDDLIAEVEWLVGGESALVVRRLETKTVEAPGVPWDLAGIQTPPAETQEGPRPGVTPDMIISNVSVQHMVEKADFETYIFASDPPWAARREITDVLDVASPPHRMFAISYLAQDGRHVALVQSYTYNKMIGPSVRQGTLVYTSPTGVKVWSGPRGKWLAGILIRSSPRISRPPAEDRTGYFLETPAGTFPALAVNGPVSEAELHALIDSLIPAKEHRGR